MPGRLLDPQVEAYRRERHAAGVRPLHELSVAEAREAELSELQPAFPEPVAQVFDRTLPGIEGDVPVRFYLPEAARPLPVLVYLFGGGWVLGSLEAVDPVCRRLANATPCAVVRAAAALLAAVVAVALAVAANLAALALLRRRSAPISCRRTAAP